MTLRDKLKEACPNLRSKHLDFLECLYDQFHPYADRDFEGEILKHLHDRFWEMYLGCALLDTGHKLVPRYERKADGPDICVIDGSRKIWIEATAPECGQGDDAVPEIPCDGESHLVPTDKLMLRLTSAFSTKRCVFSRYREKGIVNEQDAAVIAISGGRLGGWARLKGNTPLIVRALYELGSYTLMLDSVTKKTVDKGHIRLDSIPKCSGAAVSADGLLGPATADVSAVIFSSADVFNAPPTFGTDFVTCHHAQPRVALPLGWFDRAREFWVEDGRLCKREPES